VLGGQCWLSVRPGALRERFEIALLESPVVSLIVTRSPG
jgi:hypothetical protein